MTCWAHAEVLVRPEEDPGATRGTARGQLPRTAEAIGHALGARRRLRGSPLATIHFDGWRGCILKGKQSLDTCSHSLWGNPGSPSE